MPKYKRDTNDQIHVLREILARTLLVTSAYHMSRAAIAAVNKSRTDA